MRRMMACSHGGARVPRLAAWGTAGRSGLAAGLVALGLVMAACGGGTGSAPAKAPQAGGGAGGQVPAATQPAQSSAGAAPAARGAGSSAHPWPAGQAWQAMGRLGNYAFHAEMTAAGAGVQAQGATLTVDARYHSATDYQLTIAGGTSPGATLIQAGNGHRYVVQPGGHALDLGTAGQSQSPVSAMFESYQAAALGPWTGLFSGSRGTYAGPCSVAGRPGDRYVLGGATSPVTAAMAGASITFSGSACIDAATGAPLQAAFQWKESAQGKSFSYGDSMQVTAVGSVAAIPAPAGAQALPAGVGLPGGSAGVPGAPGGAGVTGRPGG